MQGLTKEEVTNIRVNTTIFVIKDAVRIGKQLATKMGIDFQEFLSSRGFGNQKYSKVDLEKAQLWKSLSFAEKDLIAEWYQIKGNEKREKIQEILAIKTDAEIDKFVIKFESLANYFSPYWDNKALMIWRL